MIRYKMILSDEKRQAAIEIALNSEKNISKRKKVAITAFVSGIIEFVLGFCLILNGVNVFGFIMIAIGLSMMILSSKAKDFQKYALKNAEKLLDNAFRTGIVEYVFDVDGIQTISKMGNVKNYWNAFKEYGTMGQYIYAKRKDNKMILVDQNDLSAEELEELKQLLSSIKKVA